MRRSIIRSPFSIRSTHSRQLPLAINASSSHSYVDDMGIPQYRHLTILVIDLDEYTSLLARDRWFNS